MKHEQSKVHTLNNITNLYDFTKYCETVLEDSNDLFVLELLGSRLNPTELLQDMANALGIYYMYLNEAIEEEMYLVADLINKAKEAEKTHYRTLIEAILKEDYSVDINKIDNKLAALYLN